jgi:predicted membrane protein
MNKFFTKIYESRFLRAVLWVIGTILLFDYGLLPLLSMANTLANIIGVILTSTYLYVLYQVLKDDK